MRVVKIFFGLVCFGSGVAFAMDAIIRLWALGRSAGQHWRFVNKACIGGSRSPPDFGRRVRSG